MLLIGGTMCRLLATQCPMSDDIPCRLLATRCLNRSRARQQLQAADTLRVQFLLCS